MRQIEVLLHGHRVVCRVAGDPGLPVILLIHGITCGGGTWDPVIPALAEHAHVIAPDLLGHGESDKPRTDYSLSAFASGMRDLLECLGHERVTVVGHSLGGGVAMQFAYQYFEYCERLVLVSSGGLGREVSLALRAATLPGAELVLPVIINGRVRDAGMAAARLLRWLPMRPGPSMAEVLRGYASLADSPARDAFVQTLRSVVEPAGQRIAATDRLYLAEGRPTLIVWGKQDIVIPVAHAGAAHAAIPGSVLEVFERAGHFPHLDEPERFARVLVEFLHSTEPAPIDRSLLRARMTSHGRALREQQALGGKDEAAVRADRGRRFRGGVPARSVDVGASIPEAVAEKLRLIEVSGRHDRDRRRAGTAGGVIAPAATWWRGVPAGRTGAPRTVPPPWRRAGG